MAGRILVIRGGAIGDFVLTLPALSLLRENYPETQLELLGYQHIIALAHRRHYAVGTRSIEYGPLARFFIPGSDLPKDLMVYFSGFNQVISYLFDPDGSFAGNLERCGVKYFLACPGKLDDSAHAAQQLARPLERMALYLEETAAVLHPSKEDFAAAAQLFAGNSRPCIAIHPGSGGAQKIWPVERWAALGRHLTQRASAPRLVLTGGEADERILSRLKQEWKDLPVLVVENKPLPVLAAVLGRCSLYLGHDSGISHIAAAAGSPCTLLFGPTDPAVWAPTNPGVEIIASPTGSMDDLTESRVLQQVTTRCETLGF